MKALLERLDRPTVIGIILILALVILTFLLVFFKVPDSDVFKMLVGGLLTMAVTVTQFDFGSSSGSKDKDVARDKALNSAVVGLSNNQAPANGGVAANPAVKAILALFAILFVLSIAMPAFAAEKKQPSDCLQPVDPRPACKNGIFAPGGAVDKVAGPPSSTDPDVSCDFKIFIGLTPRNLEASIKKCISDVNSTLADDTKRALDSAIAYPDNDGVNCLKPGLAILQAGIIVPAQPAIDAIPENPNTTPPTPAVAAVPAQPAKNPGLILLFQKYREFILSGGLTSCQTWVNTPVNATIAQGLNNAGGVVGAAAAAAALMPIK